MLTQRFPDFDSMYTQAIDDVLRHGSDSGSRVEPMRELLFWAGTVDAQDVNLLRNKRRHMDVSYAWAEVLWYLSGESNIRRIVPYAPQYVKWAQNGNAGGYAYGNRVQWPVNQLQACLELLSAQPETRRAAMSILHPQDALQAHWTPYSHPCGLSWVFYVRDGLLNMMATVRSQDLWLGMPYDVFANCQLLKLMASTLGLAPGEYMHVVGSLHIYDKYKERCAEARESDQFEQHAATGYSSRDDNLAFTAIALSLEAGLREGVYKSASELKDTHLYNALEYGSVLSGAVLGCATRWLGTHGLYEEHPCLEEELYNANRRGPRPRRQDDVLSRGLEGDQ